MTHTALVPTVPEVSSTADTDDAVSGDAALAGISPELDSGQQAPGAESRPARARAAPRVDGTSGGSRRGRARAAAHDPHDSAAASQADRGRAAAHDSPSQADSARAAVHDHQAAAPAHAGRGRAPSNEHRHESASPPRRAVVTVDDLVPGSRLMARSLGWLILCAVGVYFAWLALRPGPDRLILAAAALPAIGLSGALFAGVLDGRRPRVFKLLMAATTVLLSVLLALDGGQSSPLAMFSLWVVPYAFLLFSLRDALSQLALAAACVAAGLALQRVVHPGASFHPRKAEALWVLTVSSGLALGLLFRTLGARLRTVDLRLRQSFDQASVGMAILSAEGTLLDVNRRLCALLSRTPEQLVGRRSSAFTHPDDPIHDPEWLASLPPGGGTTVEKRLLRPGDEAIWCRVTTSRIASGADHFFCQIEDISEFRQAASDAAVLAHDNELILECAGDGIYRTDSGGTIVYANPACARMLGYTSAELIGRRAHELMHHTREDGSPYPPNECPGHAAVTAGEVRRARAELFWRRDGTSFWGDLTIAPAREHDRVVGAVCVFADVSDAVEQERERARRHETEQMIRAAIQERRLVAYAQPILDLRSRRVCGEELLVRMRGRGGELIPPAEFLPRAERDGHVHLIDRWMTLVALRRALAGRTVFVNISGRSLADPALLAEIEAVMGDQGPPPGELVFEITETAAVDRIEEARTFSARMRRLGCRLAIDDFGTGYGGFNYVKGFSTHYLKIDIDFVRDLADSESDQRIVRTIVALARDFGKLTIAEGVEDERALELLREFGVDLAQGFLIGRPEPIDEQPGFGA